MNYKSIGYVAKKTSGRIPLSPPNLVYTGSTDLDIPTSGV
jgi:hypothetical protein